MVGGSRVTLTHGGWEALGEIGPLMRQEYLPGWRHLLGRLFADFAQAEILIRLVCDSGPTCRAVEAAAEGRAALRQVLLVDAVRMGSGFTNSAASSVETSAMRACA